ncbi:MAG: LLM class flavin-dependent oxidoreductase [Thaumarchaeota archaeon]|nr:LLM class flavin-dependent oxidoreductase [Nitrososphaerota archaeon]
MKADFGFAVPILAGGNDNLPRIPCSTTIDFGAAKEATILCEKLGYDALYMADHLSMGGEILEGWTVLSALSAVTKSMRLGTIHTASLFRNPALLAKMSATLDCISNGRLDLFLEAGHLGGKEETVSYGLPWSDDANVRAAMLEEAIAVILQLWSGDESTFRGKYYSTEGAVCRPRPVQDPHPPIWIGTGGGEPAFTDKTGADEVMIKVVAKHADVWNNTPASVEHCRLKLKRLEEECITIGRDVGEITKSLETQVFIAKNEDELRRQLETVRRFNPAGKFFRDYEEFKQFYIAGTTEECIKRIQDYRRLGFTKFIVWFGDYPSLDGVRQFAADVIPQFR